MGMCVGDARVRDCGAAVFVALGETDMSFGIYAVGYLIVIAGVAYLASLMHIPQKYIIAIVVIMLGIGITTGVRNTRGKDPN